MADREAPRANTAESPEQAARQLRLLVVDDDALSQSMMGLMLSPHGYALDFASNGAEAIKAIKSGSYDLVFMDLVLPDIDGRDVCQEIRRWEAGKRHVPIVAVTGLDLPGQPLALIKAGMDDYVFKPYDVRTLTRLIGLYTGGEETAGAPNAGDAAAALRDTPVLDINGSLQDFADDVDSYRELLGDFVNSLPSRLEKMRRAQQSGDVDALGRECHSLKGISAGLGALRLARISSQFCTALRSGQPVPVADKVCQVEQCMNELKAQAKSYLGC